MARDLPIYEIEKPLIGALQKFRRLIVQAPTGSGKSTQVPQMLLDHDALGSAPNQSAAHGSGQGQVVILQPRRLATRMLAARVAQERNAPLGQEVGYQIRFENISGPATRIKFVTEGILLRQMLTQPRLDGISTLIFDEFHERHLYGDITLARALQLQESIRPDLNILVMSATLAARQLEQYLNPCLTLESHGRTFPVTVEYLPHPADEPASDLATRAFEDAMRRHPEGDVLIFMPGAYEISRTVQSIRASDRSRGFIVLPLHGELPPREQDAAVARYDQRKVIVSTNVAETSLTIEGVRLVIDCGLARIPKYDPYRGINTLLIEKISRASADQRMGRAGRTAPGHCIRLWTEREQRERPAQELPEVKRLDLAEVVLTLKASGIRDVAAFRWLEAPEPRSLARAELLLKDLGAVDAASGEIRELGRRMLAFPVHPRYSRMLLAAHEYGCVYQVCLIAALTQGRDLLMRRQGKQVGEKRDDLFGDEAASDFFVWMRAWSYADKNQYNLDACRRLGIHAQSARQVRPLFEHFLNIARQEGLNAERTSFSDEIIQKCILTGFSDQLARRLDTGTLRCELVHDRRGTLARESVVAKSPLLVAAEVHEIEGKEKELNVLLSLCTAVKPEWLKELFPSDFSEKVAVLYDSAAKRVYAEEQWLFRDLVLEKKRNDQPPPDAAAALLAEEVLKGNLTLKEWDHEVEQWLLRVTCLAGWCPELGLPIITAEDRKHMIAQICHGAVSYREIKDKPVRDVVRGWLNPAQQALVEKHSPERFELPGGRRVRVTYSGETPPYMAARIQDLYDLKQSPKIAMGRVALLVHILGPNQRPVQITQDLSGFWKNHYPRIKQELQRKYPKHEWR
jgi:ATP-dependent helicase HrpB